MQEQDNLNGRYLKYFQLNISVPLAVYDQMFDISLEKQLLEMWYTNHIFIKILLYKNKWYLCKALFNSV